MRSFIFCRFREIFLGLSSRSPIKVIAVSFPPRSSYIFIAVFNACSRFILVNPCWNLFVASEYRPCLLEVLLLKVGSKIAASSKMVVVESLISESFPPITPAIPNGNSGSAINKSEGSKSLVFPSSVVILSPFFAVLTIISSSLTARLSNACMGWPYSSMIRFVISATLLTDLTPESVNFLTQSLGDEVTLNPSTFARQ